MNDNRQEQVKMLLAGGTLAIDNAEIKNTAHAVGYIEALDLLLNSDLVDLPEESEEVND